ANYHPYATDYFEEQAHEVVGSEEADQDAMIRAELLLADGSHEDVQVPEDAENTEHNDEEAVITCQVHSLRSMD
uniref:Polyprotein n=1 Tax=Steinernema glaseri TaxID=37863 RepID=A0A1I7Y6T0_9BILA